MQAPTTWTITRDLLGLQGGKTYKKQKQKTNKATFASRQKNEEVRGHCWVVGPLGIIILHFIRMSQKQGARGFLFSFFGASSQ